MKSLILLFIFIPISIFAFGNSDSTSFVIRTEISKLNDSILQTNKELSELKIRLEVQENINEKVINGISTQLNAASLNLTIFGILFAIAAIILGIYVTRIESKVVRIKEENLKLLNETIKNKEQVVEINNLIQKDIHGLFLKIKREETIHILNRLVVVPKDISNLSEQLLSRELEKEDFNILKEAYLNLLKIIKDQNDSDEDLEDYLSSYKLLFFQHFLDLSLKDEIIGKDLINYMPLAIRNSFDNDIIKSTKDFMNVILELGFKTKEEVINSYIKGVASSIYKNSNLIYKIIFDKLQNKENQFGFFNIISEENNCILGKSNFGKLLIKSYENSELNEIELSLLQKAKEIIAELDKKETEQKELDEKDI